MHDQATKAHWEQREVRKKLDLGERRKDAEYWEHRRQQMRDRALRKARYPDDLADAPRWVVWREELRKGKDGTEVPTKVPYQPKEGGRRAATDDPSTWDTRDAASARWKQMQRRDDLGGIGIVLGDLGDGTHLMGIDLDRCRNVKTGTISPWADEVIEQFATYAEISPSGKGVKLFFLIAARDAPAVMELMDGKARRAFPVGSHREIALDRIRYYAVTGNSLNEDAFRLCTPDDVRWLLEDVGPRFQREHGSGDVKERTRGRDESGSGYGFRFMGDCKARGMNYPAARKAILADKGEGGAWARRSNERQLERAWDNAPQESNKQYEMVRAADVIIRPLQWLWKGHLLRGAQELVTGIKGMGKSQLQCSLVACATTGRDWPNGERGPERGNAFMVTAEDVLDQVVVPRLMAAGADLNRVYFLKAIRQDNKSRMFLLGEDLEVLEQMIKDVGDVNLVTIDPLTAYMGKINSSSPTDVRGQLGPLKDLAERTDVAFSTVTHPPKEGGQRAVDHFIGSQAFIAAARIGHLCQPEMTVEAKPAPTGRKLYTMVPGNHMMMPTLAYGLEVKMVGDNRATRTEAPYVAWQEEVELTADQAIAAGKGSARTTSIDDFVSKTLADGPMWIGDLEEEAKEAGFTKNQLDGAKERLGIKPVKVGLSGWEWGLPRKEEKGECG